MKAVLALLLTSALLSIHSSAQTGNVGIGTATPGTKLDVAGAITVRQDTVYVLSNAVTVPPNAGQVSIQGFASGTITVTAPTPQNAGQQLTIVNNAAGNGHDAKMNGYCIPSGRSLTFKSTSNTASSFQAESFIGNTRDLAQAAGSTIPMAPSDYFVVLSFGGSKTYVLDNPTAAGNKGRTVVIYNGNSSASMTVSSNSGSQINNTGSSSYSSTIGSYSVFAGARTMLICDGTYWIRIF